MDNPTILFLDDDPHRWRMFRREFPFAAWAETAAQVIRELESRDSVDWLFLDHDLGGRQFVDASDPESGMEVVRWIEAHSPAVRWIVVHSHNGPRAAEMTARLRAKGYLVIQRSFAFLDIAEISLAMGLRNPPSRGPRDYPAGHELPEPATD